MERRIRGHDIEKTLKGVYGPDRGRAREFYREMGFNTDVIVTLDDGTEFMVAKGQEHLINKQLKLQNEKG